MCVCESESGKEGKKTEEEVMMMEGIERALDNIEALLYTPTQTHTETHTQGRKEEVGGGTRERVNKKVQRSN